MQKDAFLILAVMLPLGAEDNENLWAVSYITEIIDNTHSHLRITY